MKFLFLSLTLFFGTFILVAQDAEATLGTTVVPVEEVPQVVRDAQEALFPGVAVRTWRKRSAEGQRIAKTTFLAIFNQDKINTRVQFAEDGTGISVYATYAEAALPAPIQASLTTTYSDYRLTGAAEITALKSGKSGFRLRFRDGAKKLVLWVDENGQEITGTQTPDVVE